MANTTNFGWETPDDTDLVKDGAAAMRTLGGAIDTSMMDLKGGTSGQILAKNSNTDMDFVWIANDQGDITGVAAGTGLSGGGTSGSVTLSIDTATTVDKTTAQTLTNKTLTSPIISTISNTGTLTLPTSTDTLVGRATTDTLTNKTLTAPVISTISNTGTITLPTSTDTLVGRATTDTLTNKTISASSNTLTGVINNTLTTTTGDIIYASSANTPARLGIGSSGQILTVSGGIPSWATASSSAKILQVVVVSDTTQTSTTSTSLVTTGLSASITPASTSNKVLVQVLMHGSSQNNGSLTETSSNFVLRYTNTTTDLVDHAVAFGKSASGLVPEVTTGVVLGIQHSPSSTSSCTYEVFMKSNTGGSNTTTIQRSGAVMILMEVAP